LYSSLNIIIVATFRGTSRTGGVAQKGADEKYINITNGKTLREESTWETWA